MTNGNHQMKIEILLLGLDNDCSNRNSETRTKSSVDESTLPPYPPTKKNSFISIKMTEFDSHRTGEWCVEDHKKSHHNLARQRRRPAPQYRSTSFKTQYFGKRKSQTQTPKGSKLICQGIFEPSRRTAPPRGCARSSVSNPQ